MNPFWFCALHHARSLRDDHDLARRAAGALNAPALRSLRRVAVRIKGDDSEYRPKSPTQALQHLQNPEARGIWLDSGSTGDFTALGIVETALDFKPDANVPAPMWSYLVMPYVADDLDAVLDVFCTLAELLDAAYGTASVEPSFNTAHNAACGTRPSSADAPTYTVMTPDRIRYRRTPGYRNTEIDRFIGGPEWGTFMGPGHLAKISVATMAASGSFHEVRPLAHGGAFLRLSADPMDTQTDAILAMVATARAALEPIVMDVSDVRV